MDTESINSLLKYFPYTEAEKDQVRELLIKRDPTLMTALNNFLHTKDVTALNKEFKTILSAQGSYRTSTTTITTPVESKYDWKSSTNAGPVIYTSPNISTKTYETTSYGGNTSYYAQPQTVTSTNVSYSQPQPVVNTLNQQSPLPQPKSVYYGADVKEGDGKAITRNLTESAVRIRSETKKNIEMLRKMAEYAAERKTNSTDENKLKSFKFDFLPEKIKNNYIDAESKKELIRYSSQLSFEHFLDIRHFLRLDKIDLVAFVDKAKARVEELHPLKAGEDKASYNPGFSLEEFIGLLCGNTDIPKTKMGYIGLLFYYLDYNHNQILESDEILQGFIMLGPGDKKDKISAAFHALGGQSLCLPLTKLAHYLEIVMRVYKLKEDAENENKSDLYDIQKAIDLAAKSLAKKIFDLVQPKDETISLEEFLIWHDKVETRSAASKEPFFTSLKEHQLENFRNSIHLAQESKEKRLTALNYSTDESTQVSTKEKFKSNILASGVHTKTLESLKKTLKVDQIDISTIVKVSAEKKKEAGQRPPGDLSPLKKVSDEKNKEASNWAPALTVDEFHKFFKRLHEEEKLKKTFEEENNFKKEIVRFYQILDTNKNGVLEWDEMISALIFVCKGSESAKCRIAFNEFDINGDNGLQFKELFFFLKGVFNLLMYDNQNELFNKETPDQIAFCTAKACFDEFGLNHETQAIEYNNFQKWYSSNL